MKTKTNKIALQLMENQKQRSSIIKMMNAQKNQIAAYITRYIGYNSNQTKEERRKNLTLGEKIFKAVIKKDATTLKKHKEIVDHLIIAVVDNANISLQRLKAEREIIEASMITKVKTLNICDWWIDMKGRSYLGLAIIIGEAGDLSNYANPAKIWKRFGLAVIDGVRQGGLPKGTAAEIWIEHGYNKKRRSSLWTIGDSLMKTNGKDGYYKQMYDKRKKYESKRLLKKWIADGKTEESFKPGHSHNRAKRYMEKALLKNLWCQWHALN